MEDEDFMALEAMDEFEFCCDCQELRCDNYVGENGGYVNRCVECSLNRYRLDDNE